MLTLASGEKELSAHRDSRRKGFPKTYKAVYVLASSSHQKDNYSYQVKHLELKSQVWHVFTV